MNRCTCARVPTPCPWCEQRIDCDDATPGDEVDGSWTWLGEAA